jgi:hypothetical protein
LKQTLESIAKIAVCLVVLAIIYPLVCDDSPVKKTSVSTPTDTSFAPVTHSEYRPPIIEGKSSPVKLPEGVSQKDVVKVTTLKVRDSKGGIKDINVVETKDGETFVEKDADLVSVDVVEYKPPIVSFGMGYGGGLSFGLKNDKFALSPVMTVSPIEWFGRVKLPVGSLDIDGIGIGASVRAYHDIHIGAAKTWDFDGGSGVKINLTFEF